VSSPVVVGSQRYVGQLLATNPSTAGPRTGVDQGLEPFGFHLSRPGNTEGCANVDFAWNAALFPLPGLFDSLPIYTNPSAAMEGGPEQSNGLLPAWRTGSIRALDLWIDPTALAAF
jgi:hypothetical protein